MECNIARSVCIVRKTGIEILNDNDVSMNEVGAKAFGLSMVPPAWTLPFFVISTEMYEMYISGIDLSGIWYKHIINAMEHMHFNRNQIIYVRSNMCEEGLGARGKFESYFCNKEELFETIKRYFDSLKRNNLSRDKVPLLIQQYAQTFGKGHVSNERRLSQEARDWKGEIENWNKQVIPNTHERTFKIPLRKWRQEIDINNSLLSPLRCSSLNNIEQVLKYPCTWATATKQLKRIHFEWIFDGTYIYIVQADQEQEYGINPESQFTDSNLPARSTFTPQILHLLSQEDKDRYSLYSKLCNPLVYQQLGLQTAPIYVLDDQQEIQELVNQNISEQLRQDISAMITNPLVIRTDVATKETSEQMLPRTDNVRNEEDAINWLKYTAKKLYETCRGTNPFVFIFHNFIPAFSSAFAYAEPTHREVLLESLWGVPEGLYYYSHDKHIVDTIYQDLAQVDISKISISPQKPNAKINCIFPDSTGRWKCNLVAPDYIWKPAIPKAAWIKEIALNTRKIAEYIGTGISVMWFIGVNSEVYGCNVFPWYHEKFDIHSVFTQKNKKKYTGDRPYIIGKNTDIEELKKIIKVGNHRNITHLLFRPTEENMIRNKEVIECIGKLANDMFVPIVLEGGILSHAYYQLNRTGAAIEVRNIFDSNLFDVEHKKLVRDKIPNKIEKGGELAITKKLSDNELFEQLRLKLVEETFEVLDANDRDELIQELADVLEVIDNIASRQHINMDTINFAKIKKREKVGSFKEGILLQQTLLPLCKSAADMLKTYLYKEETLTSWVDKQETPDYKKIFQRVKVPTYLKQWNTQFTVKGLDNHSDSYIVLKAKRIKASLQIEISIEDDKDHEQLKLFSDK